MPEYPELRRGFTTTIDRPEEPQVEVEQDYEYSVTDSSGQSEEDLIPPGRYEADFVKFAIEDKPEWKLEQQRAWNRARPAEDGTVKEPKPQQAVWTFELVEEGYEGRKLSDWQDVSWHVKSNSAKYLAALLGKSKLTGTERGTIKQMYGRRISIRVTESKGRNYIDPNGCEPIQPRKATGRPTINVLVGDESKPSFLLAQLDAAIKAACGNDRKKALDEWTALGYKGRTRDDLSAEELVTATRHYEALADF